MVLFTLAAPIQASLVGSSFIHAPAVLSNQNKGTLTGISLNVTNGDGNVAVIGPQYVNISTTSSAQTAATYAASYLNLNESDYNFTYTIIDAGGNVTGPSGGLAFTLLAISALSNRPLTSNFTVTGTIDSNGDVGQVGGVYDKAGIAAQNGMRFIIVPSTYGSAFEATLYEIIHSTFGITITEVSNVSQALPYAFGTETASNFVYNTYTGYDTSMLPAANLSCTECNSSAFAKLASFTFNLTQAEVNSIIGSEYATTRAGMQESLAQDKRIASAGYLYTAADMAYLTYLDAYTIASSGTVTTVSGARELINSTQSYCNNLSAPQLTSSNYEYVIGGQVRQAWADSSLIQAMAYLNQSDITTDGILNAVYMTSSAQGWCSASAEMYSIASSIGGTPTHVSQSLQSTAQEYMRLASSAGNNTYYLSAVSSYNSKNYAASLYSSVYAMSLYSTTPEYSMQKQKNFTIQNINKSGFGDWPYQLALESRFYLNEAALNSTSAQEYTSTAYSTSVLAYNLANATRIISAALVNNSMQNTTQSAGANTSEISGLYGRINSEYIDIELLAAAVVVEFFIIMLLLSASMRRKNQHAKRARTRRHSRRS